MIIHCPISIGELIDKITILNIKISKINNIDKLKFLHTELTLLMNIKQDLNLNPQITTLEQLLETVNTKLWNIEDAKRYHEKIQLFDNTFIDLARQVYLLNDQRAKLKQQINELAGSTLQEVKNHY